jgi:hypothetical protein
MKTDGERGTMVQGDTAAPPRRAGDTLRVMRALLYALLVFGIVGMEVELFLLGHTESATQLIPVVALGIGLLVTVWAIVRPSRGAVRAFQAVMVAFVIAGVVGLWLHYRGNAEFELEMYPTMAGGKLFWESLTGATPTLAPGTMAQLGLLGLLCAYRHPALRRARGTDV